MAFQGKSIGLQKRKNKKCNTNAKYSEKAYFRKIGKKAVNHLGMQSKPFALIKES